MPDLITHMSLNYILYRTLKKYLFITFILLGAILPDILVALQITLIDFFHSRSIEEINAAEAVAHTMAGGFLLSLVVGACFRPRGKAVLSIFTGYLLHLGLDFLQMNWGSGNLLLYPFSFRTFGLGVFTYGLEFKFAFVLIPLAFVLFFLFLEKKEYLYLAFSLKNIILSLASFCLLIFLVILFFPNTLKSDYFFLDFASRPERYDHKNLQMNLVIIKDEKPLTVYFRKHNLILKNVSLRPRKGYRYRIEGIYQHKQGAVDVIRIYEVYPYTKLFISGGGMLLFLLFVLIKVRFVVLRS